MLKFGVMARVMKSSNSWGGSNFVSVSWGDSVYSKSPPTMRRATLSMRVLASPSSLKAPTMPWGRAALGIWKPIMWNCSPKRLSRGGRVWQTLHWTSYWRAKAGTASATPTSTNPFSVAASATTTSERLDMFPPFADERSEAPRRGAIHVERREELDQKGGVQQEERR